MGALGGGTGGIRERGVRHRPKTQEKNGACEVGKGRSRNRSIRGIWGMRGKQREK